MSDDLDIVGIREAKAEDRPFIMAGWLRSFRTSHFAGPISMKRYWDVYSTEIQDLILRKNSSVRVAFNCQSQDQVFGFICFEDGYRYPLLHYIYVKSVFQRRGIAMMLAKDAGFRPKGRFFYTYRTPISMDLTRRGARFCRGKFMPLYARFQPEEQKEAEDAQSRERGFQGVGKDAPGWVRAADSYGEPAPKKGL